MLSDLKRDEALGVIERIPCGEPVSWCHRMVLARKYNSTPRRIVHLSPLNKPCERETFSTESPFHLARSVPKGTCNTVSDAWNGYHSTPSVNLTVPHNLHHSVRTMEMHEGASMLPFLWWRLQQMFRCDTV